MSAPAAEKSYLGHRMAEIDALIAKYPSRRSALLPLLWEVQKQEGWISQPAMREVAEIIGCTPAEVYEVVSFYTMFQQKPTGRHHLALCRTLSCAICGSFEVADYLADRYGVPVGGHSPDGRFSLELVECIGACSEAPAMLVGETLYGDLTPERVDEILAQHT
jgi:NADH-quinone oxidoreductase E subunit